MYKFLTDANEESEHFTNFYAKLIASIKSVAISMLSLKLVIFSVFIGMDKYRNTFYIMAYVIFLP